MSEEMPSKGDTTSLRWSNLPKKCSTPSTMSWLVVRGIDGSTDELGAEFKYRYQNVHGTTQRITEWVLGKKVVWHVVDSHINFVKDGTEWNGTDIVFEIDRKNGKTEPRFTHVGLVPTFEC